MKYRSSYGQNLLQHARETANLAGIMAAELGLNPKTARRAGLLHDIGKVPDDEPELPHAIIGMKLAEKYKEKPEVCNAIGAHHDEVEMTSLIAPIIRSATPYRVRPGARREVVSYIKRLKEMEDIALSYPGVVKTYAIQAGRELRVIVGADKLTDQESEGLSHDIAKLKSGRDDLSRPGEDHRHPRNPRRIVREIRTPPVGTGCTRPACRKFITGKIPPQNGGIFLSTALLPVSSGTNDSLSATESIHNRPIPATEGP